MSFRRVALAAALLVACLHRVSALSYTAPQEVLDRVYADKLHSDDATKVGGYVAMDRFAPLSSNEIEVVLLVAGTQRRVTKLRPDNAWAFHNVPPGTHALELVAPGFEMVTLRVDVLPSDMAQESSRRVRFSLAAQPSRWLQQPLVLMPTSRVLYKDPEAKWTLRSLIANPYYLMMGFMVFSVFVIPKMMDSMDPEEKKLLQEQMAQNGGGLSGLLSSALSGEPPQAVKKKLTAGPSSSSGGGGGGGASKPKQG